MFGAVLAALWGMIGLGCSEAPSVQLGQRARPAVPAVSRSGAPAGRVGGDRAGLQRGTRTYSPDVIIEGSPSPGPMPGWDAERLWSPHVDWEPYVAADPSSSTVYQIATRYYASCSNCPDPILVLRRSSDAGATWEPDTFPFAAGKSQNDPQLAVDDSGTLYAAYLQDFRPGAVFTRSSDRGTTWSEPVHLAGTESPGWSDHPLLVVSKDGRDVYVAFNASDSYIVASHDSGATFSAPVRTNHDRRYWFHTDGVITADGTVYIATVDYTRSYRGKVHVSVLISMDAGVSWSTHRVDTSTQTPDCAWADGCYLGFLGPRAALAVDAGGTLMLVYTAGRRNGHSHRVWYRTSADGVSWSQRRRLSRPGAGTNSAFALVAAGSTAGDFRVAWQDDRREPTQRWNTWYRRTSDGGASWSETVRLSSGGPTTSYRDEAGYAFPYGDYFRLAVDSTGTNHVIWGAGKSYSGNGGVWYARGR